MVWDLEAKLESMPSNSLGHPNKLHELELFGMDRGQWVAMPWAKIDSLYLNELKNETFCLRWREKSIFYYSNDKACSALGAREVQPLAALIKRLFAALVKAGLSPGKWDEMTFGRLTMVYSVAKFFQARIVYCGDVRERECSNRIQKSTESSSQRLA